MNNPSIQRLSSALTLLIALLTVSPARSQDIFSYFTKWSNANPIEKLYLHTDRSSYYAGQTIWLKGYFLNDLIPDSKSTSVYVELLNERADILLRQIFPAYVGVCIGQVALPEDITSGTYQLRAYSVAMLNQPGFYFTKNISIYGKQAEKANIPGRKNNASFANIQFFPEGGNLLANLVNNIAFKAVDENGFPKEVSCILKND